MSQHLDRLRSVLTPRRILLLLAGAVIPLHASRAAAEIASPESYLAPLRVELRKSWPANRTVTIVFHGHSVPTGYFRGGAVRPFDSYPHLTHVALNSNYPTSVISPIVTGIGGEHSEQGAARFRADVLAKRPDVVLIDYSLNDRAIGLERAQTGVDFNDSAVARRGC